MVQDIRNKLVAGHRHTEHLVGIYEMGFNENNGKYDLLLSEDPILLEAEGQEELIMLAMAAARASKTRVHDFSGYVFDDLGGPGVRDLVDLFGEDGR